MRRQLTDPTIGARVYEARKTSGITQRQLVDGLGYTGAYVSRIEAGTRIPSVTFLRAIAPRIGVSVAWLETGSDLVDLRIRATDAHRLLQLRGVGSVTLYTALLEQLPSPTDGEVVVGLA